MNHPRFSKSVHRQQGATLIEVLVSILLMSIGLVSMAAMQVNAVQFSKTSEMRSLASLLANDIADRIRANNPSATSYNTGTTYTEPANLPSEAPLLCVPGEGRDKLPPETLCSGPQMAAYDLASWRRDLFRQLPNGTGVVRIAPNDQVDIWVVWTDPASSNSQDADACPQGYAEPANVRCMYFRIAL